MSPPLRFLTVFRVSTAGQISIPLPVMGYDLPTEVTGICFLDILKWIMVVIIAHSCNYKRIYPLLLYSNKRRVWTLQRTYVAGCSILWTSGRKGNTRISLRTWWKWTNRNIWCWSGRKYRIMCRRCLFTCFYREAQAGGALGYQMRETNSPPPNHHRSEEKEVGKWCDCLEEPIANVTQSDQLPPS